MYFNPRTPTLISFDEIESRIQSGWICQWRSGGIDSRLIQYFSGGVHCHSSLIRRNNGKGSLDNLEMIYHGGRASPLKPLIVKYPGEADLFAPNLDRWPEFDGLGAANVMRDLTSLQYGFGGIARLALHKIPFLWRLWAFDLDDFAVEDSRFGAPFCSHAVCYAARVGGGVDPVPRKPDHLVTPNDLTWSLLYNYEGTLVP